MLIFLRVQSEDFTDGVSLTSQCDPEGQCHTHFTEEGIEAERSPLTWPKVAQLKGNETGQLKSSSVPTPKPTNM